MLSTSRSTNDFLTWVWVSLRHGSQTEAAPPRRMAQARTDSWLLAFHPHTTAISFQSSLERRGESWRNSGQYNRVCAKGIGSPHLDSETLDLCLLDWGVPCPMTPIWYCTGKTLPPPGNLIVIGGQYHWGGQGESDILLQFLYRSLYYLPREGPQRSAFVRETRSACLGAHAPPPPTSVPSSRSRALLTLSSQGWTEFTAGIIWKQNLSWRGVSLTRLGLVRFPKFGNREPWFPKNRFPKKNQFMNQFP